MSANISLDLSLLELVEEYNSLCVEIRPQADFYECAVYENGVKLTSAEHENAVVAFSEVFSKINKRIKEGKISKDTPLSAKDVNKMGKLAMKTNSKVFMCPALQRSFEIIEENRRK